MDQQSLSAAEKKRLVLFAACPFRLFGWLLLFSLRCALFIGGRASSGEFRERERERAWVDKRANITRGYVCNRQPNTHSSMAFFFFFPFLQVSRFIQSYARGHLVLGIWFFLYVCPFSLVSRSLFLIRSFVCCVFLFPDFEEFHPNGIEWNTYNKRRRHTSHIPLFLYNCNCSAKRGRRRGASRRRWINFISTSIFSWKDIRRNKRNALFKR